MEKFSIIDWLILQTRKDLTYIRRSMEHESVNLAIFADLFIAFVAFSLEHVFRTVNEETGAVEKVVPSVYWIFVSALLFIIPAIIFFVGYRKREKYKFETKLAVPVDYLIDLFDNEICYCVMTADSMRDHFKQFKNQEEEIKKFYFIEAAYYANKAISQLGFFTNQKNAITSDPIDKSEGVLFVRFENVCAIVKGVYDDLIAASDSNEEYQKYLISNKAYISVFNDLCTEISKNKGYEALQELIIKVNLEKAADEKVADVKPE